MEELYFNGASFNLNEDDNTTLQQTTDQTTLETKQETKPSTLSYEDFKYVEDATISRICTDIASYCKSKHSDDGEKIGEELVNAVEQISTERNNKVRELQALDQKIEDGANKVKNAAAKANVVNQQTA